MPRKRTTLRSGRPPSQRTLRMECCERRDMLAGDAQLELVNLFDLDSVAIMPGGTFVLDSGSFELAPHTLSYAIDVPQVSTNFSSPLYESRGSAETIGDAAFGAAGEESHPVSDLRQFLPDLAVARHAPSAGDIAEHSVAEAAIDLAHVFSAYGEIKGQGPEGFSGERKEQWRTAPASKVALETSAKPSIANAASNAVAATYATVEQAWAFELASVAETQPDSTAPPQPVRPLESESGTGTRSATPNSHSSTSWSLELGTDFLARKEPSRAVVEVDVACPAEPEPDGACETALAELDPGAKAIAARWWSAALEWRDTWATLVVGALIAATTWGRASEAPVAASEPRRKLFSRRK